MLHTLLVSSFYHLHNSHILCVVCVTSLMFIQILYVSAKTWHTLAAGLILTPTEGYPRSHVCTVRRPLHLSGWRKPEARLLLCLLHKNLHDTTDTAAKYLMLTTIVTCLHWLWPVLQLRMISLVIGKSKQQLAISSLIRGLSVSRVAFT